MSKYYSVSGENAFGVMKNYEKCLGVKKYIKQFLTKKFNDFESAMEHAIERYNALQDWDSDAVFYGVKNELRADYIYYRKQIQRGEV